MIVISEAASRDCRNSKLLFFEFIKITIDWVERSSDLLVLNDKHRQRQKYQQQQQEQEQQVRWRRWWERQRQEEEEEERRRLHSSIIERLRRSQAVTRHDGAH